MAHTAPFGPDARIDTSTIWLGALGTGLPFFGALELASHAVVSWWVLRWLLVGAAALVTLVVTQYTRPEPLTPVELVSHTLPVTGISLPWLTVRLAIL